jgi:hypothetical protein
VKRSKTVAMGAVVALSAALLGGCAQEPSGPTGEYDERVPDEWCDDGNEHRGSSHFVYFPYSHGVPNKAHPVGSKVVGGSAVKPASGSFVRGGFGGTRGGAGGG